MNIRKRAVAVVLSILAVGGTSVLAAGTAEASTLQCRTTTGNTGGTATCTGSGTWRIRLNCAAEKDYVGRWVRQRGGSVRQNGECTFDNRKTTVETG